MLAALARSTPGATHPLITAVNAHADRRSRDAFAQALFERWLSGGSPFERWLPEAESPKEKWAMRAIGLLGSDGAAPEPAREEPTPGAEETAAPPPPPLYRRPRLS